MKRVFLALLVSMAFQNLSSQNWRHTAALDSFVFDKKFKTEAPGFAVLVIENGRIVYEKQQGMANLNQKLPIRAETMFNIGSITKQFTAAAIFMLEDRGLLKTSDPVQKYLPELPDFGAKITLQHLISHTSGIPDHFEVMNMQDKWRESFCDFSTVVKILQAAPELGFTPGSDFAYCNTGYMLLAMVVERVSGMDFHSFLVKNVFSPLGMKHSNCHQKEVQGLPDGTTSYHFDPKKNKFKHTKPWPNATGATGIQCTLHDFLEWDKNFWQPKIFSPAVAKNMETSGKLNDGSPTNYGGGLLLKPFDGHRMVSHGGGWSSFLMEYRRFPDAGIAILVASNNDFSSPFPLADAISRVVLPQKIPLNLDVPQVLELPFTADILTGNYLSNSNFLRKISAKQLTFQLQISENSILDLQFLSKNLTEKTAQFLDSRGDTLVFQFSDDMKKCLGFWWSGGHYFRVNRFYQKLGDAPADLKIFAGKYRNDNRKFDVRVRRDRRGNLKLKPFFFLKYPLDSVGGNVFRVRGEPIFIRFLENEIVVGNDWANGLRMKKI